MAGLFGRGISRHPRYYSDLALSDDETVYDSDDDDVFFGAKGDRDIRVPYGIVTRRRRHGRGAGRLLDVRRYVGPDADETQYFPDLAQVNPISRAHATVRSTHLTAHGPSGGNTRHEHHHHHHHYVHNASNPNPLASVAVPRQIECRSGPGSGFAPLDYPRSHGLAGRPRSHLAPPALAGPGCMVVPAGPGGGGPGGVGVCIGRSLEAGRMHAHEPGGGCGICDCCIASFGGSPLGRSTMGRSPYGSGPGRRLLGGWQAS